VLAAEARILPLPPVEAGTWFSYPGGMQGWVDLRFVKADQLGIEPVTSPMPYCSATSTQHATLALLQVFIVDDQFFIVYAASWFTNAFTTDTLSNNW